MSPKKSAALFAGILISIHTAAAQDDSNIPVRRAIPLSTPSATAAPPEPPTAPAVPFDFDKPSPTPAPGSDQASPAPVPAKTLASDKIQIDYANSLYARKMYDMAATEYEKYITLYPMGADMQAAYYRLGESYRAIGNLNAAKNAYDTLLSGFTGGDFVGPAAYRLADIYFQAGNNEMALALFRRASVRMTDPAAVNSAKYFTARCLENLSSLVEARLTYEDVAAAKENNPYREASILSLARLLSDSGKKAEALAQYETLAKETKNTEVRAEAFVKAALLKIDLGQGEKATADLEQAVKEESTGPWKTIARIGLLRVYYSSGKFKQLIATYSASPADFSGDSLPEVLLLVANAQRQLANHKDARALYEQIIKKYPDSTYASQAQYERLVSLYSANDPALAAEADKYLAKNPVSEKRDQIALLKAESLYRKQDYAAAATAYAAINLTSLAPNLKAEAQFKLGWCLMQVRNYAQAIPTFTTFLETNPQHKLTASALAQRAIAFQQTQDLSSALKDFSTLISDYPKTHERELALQQKALILGQQQDNQGMSETFQLLLKDYPQTTAAAQANYWIGWAAFEAKDFKNAIPPLEAARKADAEQFYERATLRIMLSHRYLEERDALAAEVDSYLKTAFKTKVPAEILRWLGVQFLTDKNYGRAENYLAALTARRDEAAADDWLNLGRCQASQKRFDDAAKSFAVYLAGTKEPIPRATGLLALGDAQLGIGKFDDAQKSADEACALQPEGRLNADGRILAGEIQMARSNFDEAAKLFQSVSVIMDDPNITPHAMELATEALKKAGRDDEAAKVFNQLQTRYAEYLQNKKTAQ
jgi:TolA-binding protein